jgi:hypothetical protein
MQGKQAKIVSPTQERAILGYLETTRSPHRDRVIFLLSMKAGLRARRNGLPDLGMVTDATGQVAEAIQLQNRVLPASQLDIPDVIPQGVDHTPQSNPNLRRR